MLLRALVFLLPIVGFIINPKGGGGGGGAPSGPAGGALAGEYPEPGLKAEGVTTAALKALAVTAAKIAAGAIETAKIAAEAVTTAKLAKGATGWLIATQIEGVDPTGTTDSTVGLENAIKEAFALKLGLYIPAGEYKIGEGKRTLDLSNALWGAVNEIKFELYCDSGAKFIGNAELAGKPLINLTPPNRASCSFIGSRFKFGWLECLSATTNAIVVNRGALIDCVVEVSEIRGGQHALYLGCFKGAEGQTQLTNNIFVLQRIKSVKNGIVLQSEHETINGQLSGNQFFFGQIVTCAENGIAVDVLNEKNEVIAEANLPLSSELNDFYGGAIEGCVNGILERNGRNRFIGVTVDSCEHGFVLSGTPIKGIPYVRGWFETTGTAVVLNAKPADITNLRNGELGWIPLEEVSAKLTKGTITEGGKQWACAVSEGRVWLTGNGNMNAEIKNGEQLFKLPLGCRPTKARDLAIWSQGLQGAGLEVLPSGRVNAIASANPAFATGVFLDVDSASFPLQVLGE
jgi:hypothetical protein